MTHGLWVCSDLTFASTVLLNVIFSFVRTNLMEMVKKNELRERSERVRYGVWFHSNLAVGLNAPDFNHSEIHYPLDTSTLEPGFGKIQLYPFLKEVKSYFFLMSQKVKRANFSFFV